MPQWTQYSGTWPLQTQMQAAAAGTWPVLPDRGGFYSWGRGSDGRLGTLSTTNRSSPTQVGSEKNWISASSTFKNNAFVLAIKSNGTLWGWGKNDDGQLGINVGNVNYSSPVQIGALTNWAKSACGGTGISLAIKTDGTLWSWGENSQGGLGLNNLIPRSSPVQVGSLANWADVAVGTQSGHVIATKTDGTLWLWGSNENGQLGTNNLTGRSSPIQVGALTNWSKVSAGNSTSFAVKTDGTLWAWGVNNGGQLGTNNTIYRSSPVQIGALTNWSKISCGQNTAFSIKTDQTLWGWGSNGFGELGTNDVVTKSSPVQIGSLTWLNVSSGNLHSGAVKTDGTLWSWGYNANGELGQNNATYRSSPVQVGALTDWLITIGGYQSMYGIAK